MYCVPNLINDDWFVIYATLCGKRNGTVAERRGTGEPWRPTYAVSNDLCRDHKLSFLSPRCVQAERTLTDALLLIFLLIFAMAVLALMFTGPSSGGEVRKLYFLTSRDQLLEKITRKSKT